MATRSVVAIPAGDGWMGRYVHWDGGPGSRLPVLLEIVARDGRVRRPDMELMTVQTQAGLRLMCEWFVMCDRPAEWGALGPDRTYLPICQRCADRVGFKPEELATYELSGPWNEEA